MINSKVIIVIGLPGSGKTYFCKNFCQSNAYVLIDDFISGFYNGNLLDFIISGQKIIINDPRLCIQSIFSKYVSIIETYVNRNQIHLVLFENQPDQCIINALNRNEKKNNIKQTIMRYSENYHTINYINWNHEIIKVYCDYDHN